MQRVPTSNDDEVAYIEPLGAGRLFGAGVMLALIGVIVFASIRWFSQPAVQNASGVQFLLLALAPLLVVTVLLVQMSRPLIRIAVTFNRRARTVTRRWGHLVPMFARTWPMTAFDRLQIGFIAVPGGRGRTQFAVSMAGPNREVVIGRGEAYGPLGEMAAAVAVFLGMDVLDQTATPPIRLQPDALKLRRQDDAGATSHAELETSLPAPVPCLIARSFEANRVLFAFPVAGKRFALVLWLSAAAGLVALVAYNAILWDGWGSMGGALFFAVVGGFMLLVFADSAAPATMTLIVTPSDLTIAQARWYGTSRQQFQRDRIHRLTLNRFAIAFVADGFRRVIGHGSVSDVEMAWVYAHLLRMWPGIEMK